MVSGRALARALGVVLTLIVLAGCAPGPRSPEECKVTTDPEACRKQFEHR